MYMDKMKTFLDDFKKFIDYLKHNEVTIGKVNKYISPKFLYEMNKLMHVEQKEVTPRSAQLAYPMLHLFYNLSKNGKLFIEQSIKGSKFALKPTERLERYHGLNNVEKYICLLEILWMDCDFEKLQYQTYESMNVYSAKMIIKEFYNIRPNETISIQNNITHYSTILLYLSYFGMMDIKENEEKKAKAMGKRSFVPGEIRISKRGSEIIKILHNKRDLEKWNIPYRKKHGERKIKFDEPFYKPFQNLFNKEEIENTLPRNKDEFRKGIYIFKVSLSRGVWSKIQLSAQHTLDDLHDCIQEAFDFDNDHMYSFFMDGRAWSKDKFTCPYDYEGPYSHEVKIGELQLYKKQKFLYLFDYGDEWRFNVEVFDIEDSDVKLLRPIIIESKGEAPQQYPDWDDE